MTRDEQTIIRTEVRVLHNLLDDLTMPSVVAVQVWVALRELAQLADDAVPAYP